MSASSSNFIPRSHFILPPDIPDYALRRLERTRDFGCYAEEGETEVSQNRFERLVIIPEEEKIKVEQSLKHISGSITDARDLGIYDNRKEYISDFFDRVMDTLYRSVISTIDMPIKVMVCGRVAGDGLGDLFHILNIYEIMKRTFPKWNLLLVCDVVNLKERIHLVKCLLSNRCSPILFDAIDRNVVYENNSFSSERALQSVKKHVDNFADKSNLLLNISHRAHLVSIQSFYYDFVNIREYGIAGANKDSSGDSVHVMGFSPSQLGILTLPPFKKQLGELKSQYLKQILFGSGDAQSYILSTHLVYGYIKDQDLIGGYKVEENAYARIVSFVVACCMAFKSSCKPLDLVIPYSSTNYETLKQMTHILFEECGIGTIELCHLHQPDLCWLQNVQNEEKKRLRIINPFPLDYQDVRILTAASENCVACIGDGSFTEVLSEDKPKLPFYGIYRTKGNFFISFVYLTYEVLSRAFPERKQFHFFDYLLALAELNHDQDIHYFETAKKIGCLMSEPETLTEYQIVRDHILKYHNANEAIIDLVARQVIESISGSPRKTSPLKKLFKDLMEGKKNLIEAYEEAKKGIEEQNLIALGKKEHKAPTKMAREQNIEILYPTPQPSSLPTLDPAKPPDWQRILYDAI